MADVSGRTLMMAIQAVDGEVQQIREELEEIGDGPNEADLQDLLLAFTEAADELKAAYLEELETSEHLPPYEELVS